MPAGTAAGTAADTEARADADAAGAEAWADDRTPVRATGMAVIATVQRQRLFTQVVSDEWWRRAPYR
ncbi:MAG: hypothetical protein VW780_07045 [Actinomycetota bacterium]